LLTEEHVKVAVVGFHTPRVVLKQGKVDHSSLRLKSEQLKKWTRMCS